MKKIVSTGLLLFFVVTFLIGNNVTQASASFDGITNSVNDFKVETDNGDTGGVSSISNSLSIDKEQGIDIERPPYSVYSNFSVSGDRMNFSDTLTAADPDDFWFFSVDTDRSIVLKIQTENPDYVVKLYQVDWETQTLYPTTLEGTPGEQVTHSQLPSGDWALRVYSTNTYLN